MERTEVRSALARRKRKGRAPEGGGLRGERRLCRRRCRIVYISIWGIMLLLHAVAWSSKRFCDWYVSRVYRIWVDTYGRAVGMVPFSVGEMLIGLGAGFAAAGAGLGALGLTGLAVKRYERGRNQGGDLKEAQRKERKRGRIPKEAQGKETERNWRWETNSGREPEPGLDMDETRRKEPERQAWHSRLRKFIRAYCRAGLWILLGIFALMTLNCYILYHASGFAEKYLEAAAAEYSLEELETLRNFVVEQCNALCCRIPRNEDGTLSYRGDMEETAKTAMRQLGETYSLLEGFYPNPKPLLCSDFMSRQYVAGCFYPFSMEANYNDVMYLLNRPSTICHELGHLKGFIREDEANLIGYLACVRTEDIYFQYSGYLSVLYYIDNDYREAADYERYLTGAAIHPQVHRDNIFLTAQERARIEREALLDTETVDAVSDSIADASLKLNGVRDGMVSYSRVVELLLRYYDICGYP